MSGLSVERCTSYLKSVALNVLSLLAFYAQKFRGHVTLVTPPFRQFLRDCPWKHVKFEVRSFNRFKQVSLTDPLLTDRQTDRQKRTHTHRTNTISAIHFVHLAEIKVTWAQHSSSRLHRSESSGIIWSPTSFTTAWQPNKRGCCILTHSVAIAYVAIAVKV